MSEFQLAVVAPDRSVVEESVRSVILPGISGYLGVLAGHAPVITALKPGFLEYENPSNERHVVAVSGGFAEITPKRVTILADAAERATDIDVARAERALEQARKALKGEVTGITTEEATAELDRAMNRLQVAKKM